MARIKSTAEKRAIARRASALVILGSSGGVGNWRDPRSKASATNSFLLFRLNFSRVGGRGSG